MSPLFRKSWLGSFSGKSTKKSGTWLIRSKALATTRSSNPSPSPNEQLVEVRSGASMPLSVTGVKVPSPWFSNSKLFSLRPSTTRSGSPSWPPESSPVVPMTVTATQPLPIRIISARKANRHARSRFQHPGGRRRLQPVPSISASDVTWVTTMLRQRDLTTLRNPRVSTNGNRCSPTLAERARHRRRSGSVPHPGDLRR